jgi:hypothetical protein
MSQGLRLAHKGFLGHLCDALMMLHALLLPKGLFLPFYRRRSCLSSFCISAILPGERRPKPRLSLSPILGSERIRILHEYSWRGAEDSNFFATTTVTYHGISVCVV